MATPWWTRVAVLYCALGMLVACGKTATIDVQWVVVTVEQIPVNSVLGVSATKRQLTLTIDGQPVNVLPLAADKTTDQYARSFPANQKGKVEVKAAVTMDEGDCAPWVTGNASAVLPGVAGTQVSTSVTMVKDETADLESCKAECGPGSFCWASPNLRGNHFNSVHVISAKDAWAVGDRGQVVHFQGDDVNGEDMRTPAKWAFDLQVEKVASEYDLTGVWASNAKDVWIVGYKKRTNQDSIVLHYDGASWIYSNLAMRINGTWGWDSGNVWSVGTSICELTLDAGRIRSKCSPTPDSKELFSIHGNSRLNRWATGSEIVLHWKDDSGTPDKFSIKNWGQSIRVVSDNDVRVVGAGEVIYQCNTAGCNLLKLANRDYFYHASGLWSAGDKAWFVGWGPTHLFSWSAGTLPEVTGWFSGRRQSHSNFWTWSLSGIERDLDGPLMVAAGETGAIAVGSPSTGFKTVLGNDGITRAMIGAKGQVWSATSMGIERALGSPGSMNTAVEISGFGSAGVQDFLVSPSGQFVYVVANTNTIYRRPSEPNGKWVPLFSHIKTQVSYRSLGSSQKDGKTYIVASGLIDPIAGIYTRLEEIENLETSRSSEASQEFLGPAPCVAGRDGQVLLKTKVKNDAGVFSFPIDSKQISETSRLVGNLADNDAVCKIMMSSATDAWLFLPGTTYRIKDNAVTAHERAAMPFGWERPAPYRDLWVLGSAGHLYCRTLDPKKEDAWTSVDTGSYDNGLQAIWGDPAGTIWLSGAGSPLLRLRKDRLACPPPY